MNSDSGSTPQEEVQEQGRGKGKRAPRSRKGSRREKSSPENTRSRTHPDPRTPLAPPLYMSFVDCSLSKRVGTRGGPSVGPVQIPQVRRVSAEIAPAAVSALRGMADTGQGPSPVGGVFIEQGRYSGSDVILSLDPAQLTLQEAHNVRPSSSPFPSFLFPSVFSPLLSVFFTLPSFTLMPSYLH
jgi:hypothetical protein